MRTFPCLNLRPFPLLAAAALFAGVASTQAQPTSGSFGFEVFGTTVTADNPGGLSATDTSLQNWLTTPATLTANAAANTGVDDNGFDASVYANGTATWAPDGDSGTVQMNWGWSTSGASRVNDNSTAVDQYDAIDNWTYTFTADVTGQFIMDYSVTANESEDTFGLQGIAIDLDNFDSSSNPPQLNPIDPTESGVFVGDVTEGQSYTVSLNEQGNVSSENADNQLVNNLYRVADASASVEWSIVGSPPQASVPDGGEAICLLGGALAGLAGLRRKLFG
jgi:hypothetical protein